MSGHVWVKSNLGHGEQMCRFCKGTNRELSALGQLDKCDSSPPSTEIEPITQEAVDLLRGWCGLFFGRNADASHMDNETYITAHTKQFTKTTDWLRGKGLAP